jgi:hypothetical protein
MKLTTKTILALLACTAVVGTGSAQNWRLNNVQQSTTLTTNANVSAVAIDPITGQADVNTGNVQPTGSVALTVPGGTVLINTAFNVSWAASNLGSIVTCTPGAAPAGVTGWPTAVQSGTTGSFSVTGTTIGTKTFTISCTGTSTVSDSKSVSIVDGGGPCPSANIFGQPMTAALETTWAGFFNRAFPGSSGDSGPATLNDKQYISASFQVPTGGFTPDRLLLGTTSPTVPGIEKATLAISECPGVISNVGAAVGCTGGEFSGGIELTTPGNNFPLSAGRCSLVRGRQYYLNIGQSACRDTQGQSSTCLTLISVQTTNNR